jgi:hypothetical protein
MINQPWLKYPEMKKFKDSKDFKDFKDYRYTSTSFEET